MTQLLKVFARKFSLESSLEQFIWVTSGSLILCCREQFVLVNYVDIV